MKKKKALFWLTCLLLLLLSGCAGTETEAAGKHEAGLEEMFVAGAAFRVTYEDGSSKDAERTQIELEENERETLLSMLEPYIEDLTTDVLKSDFPVYYLIKLNDVITLQIDAQGGDANAQGQIYMFVNRRIGKTVTEYGTYIGADIVDYLNARKG